VVLNGYSAHADRTELLKWSESVRATSPGLQAIHLVHGEPAAQDALAAQLTGRGFRVNVPARGDRVSF
jgi:metallo-beta-lactamase family protein